VGLEPQFDFIADLLHDHVLGANDERSILVDENFKYGVLGHIHVFGSWLRKKWVRLCSLAQDLVVVDIRPEL
jgi:hypothetical protein